MLLESLSYNMTAVKCLLGIPNCSRYAPITAVSTSTPISDSAVILELTVTVLVDKVLNH